MTMQLSGQLLLGQPVMVKTSEHERNMAWELDHAKTSQLAEQQLQQQQQLSLLPGISGLINTSSPALLLVPALPSAAVPREDLDDFDEAEGKGGGMKFNAAARQSLMSKLADSAGLQVPRKVLVTEPSPKDLSVSLQQGMLGPASPIATSCILLKNMFCPEEEASNGEGWDAEIAKDVAEECAKWGQVMHCCVDKASMVRVIPVSTSSDPDV